MQSLKRFSSLGRYLIYACRPPNRSNSQNFGCLPNTGYWPLYTTKGHIANPEFGEFALVGCNNKGFF